MTVFVYEGLPGAGKTYHAVEHWVIDSLKHGRKVLTNIEGLNFDFMTEFHGVPRANRHLLEVIGHKDRDRLLNIHKLCDFDPLEEEDHPYKNAAIVIDEAQLIFAVATIEKHSDLKSVHAWFTRHRHLGQDIVLLSQTSDYIDANLRKVVEFKYRFTKANMLKMPNRYGFVVSMFATETYVRQGVGKYRREVYLCYRSAVLGAGYASKSYFGLPLPIMAAGALVVVGSIYVGYDLWKRPARVASDLPTPKSVFNRSKTKADGGIDAVQYDGWHYAQNQYLLLRHGKVVGTCVTYTHYSSFECDGNRYTYRPETDLGSIVYSMSSDDNFSAGRGNMSGADQGGGILGGFGASER